MIEIVVDKERNLKNLTQIGTPKEEEKIYVENMAYTKIKEESYKEKRVFVLMGHTERMEGRYATFVEAAIPVREVEFIGNVPQWNNTTWSNVFREIKRVYEEMIIVGWALDIKGMSPRMTPELERVHREHFGGVHQLLFLIDSLEQEENFYMYKENRLVPKDGFYIYYRAQKNESPKSDADTSVKDSQEEKLVKLDILNEKEDEWSAPKPVARGRYRAMMQEQQQPQTKESGNTALAIAMAMLIFVLGVGVYENKDVLFGDARPTAVETQKESNKDTEANAQETTETESESTKIPVEVIPGTEN